MGAGQTGPPSPHYIWLLLLGLGAVYLLGGSGCWSLWPCHQMMALLTLFAPHIQSQKESRTNPRVISPV